MIFSCISVCQEISVEIEMRKMNRDRFECDLFDDTVNYHYLDRVWSAAYSVINTVQT